MLKKPIYKWKTKSALKKGADRKTISFENATSIGLLFDDDTNYQKSKTFIETLSNTGKTISILIKSTEKEAPSEKHFSIKQCKWHGKIDNEHVNKFIKTSFDYLFLLNKNPHYLSEYIVASSQAKCRVGIHHEGKEAFFELMFNYKQKQSIDSFYKTVEEYLTKIKAEQ